MSQTITSAATSLNQVPRLFKQVGLKRGTINLDVGGGKYDTATDYLHSQGVHNFVWDPFNRDLDHNSKVYDLLVANGGLADTATLANVLNVIKERCDRIEALKLASRAVGDTGVCYITVYEGNRSRRGKRTSKGWQHNKPLRFYLDEVKEVFACASIQGGVIVAYNV